MQKRLDKNLDENPRNQVNPENQTPKTRKIHRNNTIYEFNEQTFLEWLYKNDEEDYQNFDLFENSVDFDPEYQPLISPTEVVQVEELDESTINSFFSTLSTLEKSVDQHTQFLQDKIETQNNVDAGFPNSEFEEIVHNFEKLGIEIEIPKIVDPVDATEARTKNMDTTTRLPIKYETTSASLPVETTLAVVELEIQTITEQTGPVKNVLENDAPPAENTNIWIDELKSLSTTQTATTAAQETVPIVAIPPSQPQALPLAIDWEQYFEPVEVYRFLISFAIGFAVVLGILFVAKLYKFLKRCHYKKKYLHPMNQFDYQEEFYFWPKDFFKYKNLHYANLATGSNLEVGSYKSEKIPTGAIFIGATEV